MSRRSDLCRLTQWSNFITEQLQRRCEILDLISKRGESKTAITGFIA